MVNDHFKYLGSVERNYNYRSIRDCYQGYLDTENYQDSKKARNQFSKALNSPEGLKEVSERVKIIRSVDKIGFRGNPNQSDKIRDVCSSHKKDYKCNVNNVH